MDSAFTLLRRFLADRLCSPLSADKTSPTIVSTVQARRLLSLTGTGWLAASALGRRDAAGEDRPHYFDVFCRCIHVLM